MKDREAIDCLVELGTIPTDIPKHLFAVLVSLKFYFSLGTSLIFHLFRCMYYKTRYISCHSNLSKTLVTRIRFTVIILKFCWPSNNAHSHMLPFCFVRCHVNTTVIISFVYFVCLCVFRVVSCLRNQR